MFHYATETNLAAIESKALLVILSIRPKQQMSRLISTVDKRKVTKAFNLSAFAGHLEKNATNSHKIPPITNFGTKAERRILYSTAP